MTDLEEELGVMTPDVSQLKTLEQMINRAMILRKQIESMQETVKIWSDELLVMLRNKIPDTMNSAGIKTFTTSDGLKISIEDKISGSLPKDEKKRSDAIQWLSENGGEGIIKSELVVPFAKGEHNFKEEVKRTLAEELKIEFIEQEDVHPMTLKAFAREKLRKGENIPFDLLGLWSGREAKIKSPKDDKAENKTIDDEVNL